MCDNFILFDNIIYRGKLNTNRGNDLLKKILLHRYPHICADKEVQKLLEQYLTAEESTKKELFTQFDIDDSLQTIISASVEEADGAFPTNLGKDISSNTKKQLALYLVSFISIHIISLDTGIIILYIFLIQN